MTVRQRKAIHREKALGSSQMADSFALAFTVQAGTRKGT